MGLMTREEWMYRDLYGSVDRGYASDRADLTEFTSTYPDKAWGIMDFVDMAVKVLVLCAVIAALCVLGFGIFVGWILL